jgi:hypothetical protein
VQIGSSASRIDKRRRLWLALEKKGGCHHCTPHGGENYRRSHKRPNKDGWGMVPIKGKDKK